jgi:lipopolysaccharide export system permease protein
MQLSIRNSFAGILLQEGVFNPVREGITAFVRQRSSDGELLGIIVHDSRDKKRPITIMAERGAIVRDADDLRILMVNGSRQEVSESDGRLNMLYFDRYSIDVGADQKSATTRSRDPRERFLSELFFPSERANDIWNYHKLRMEGHDRLSSPLLGLAFPLIALAFLLCGDFNRRGQMWRIVAGVLVCTALQAAQLGVKGFAEKAPAMMPLMYILPSLVILLSGYMLLNGGWKPVRRPRLLTAG